MCAALRHRGPDSFGLRSDQNCTLGVVRLSIIDPAGGTQPAENEDGQIWVAFNGEVYNYRDLREELRQHRHDFRSASDTEVLGHLYEQYDTAAFERIRGMFAIAIWDSRRKRLILARDRFGKKPLYYALFAGGIYFASELLGLLEAGIPREVDDQALRWYFQLRYVPEPLTGLRHVKKVPAGAWMAFDSDGRVRAFRFWRPPISPDEPVPEQNETEICEQLRAKFDESVRLRMQADVPLGAFLSGGIDSSSVVASMAVQNVAPVRTFSAGFADPIYNELGYAAAVARKHHTDHHTLVIPEDAPTLIATVQKLVRHYGEPFSDSSAIPTYFLSEFASRQVKVVLSGDGGDELFAGYEIFGEAQRMSAFEHIPKLARMAIAQLAAVLPYSAYGKNYFGLLSRTTPLERYFEHAFVPGSLLRNALQPHWLLPAEEATYTRGLRDFLLPSGANLLSQSIYFATTSTLVSDMLVKVDRAAMANGLEVRCPYLDHELTALAAAVPNSWKLRNGKGKQIIFRAWGDRFPRELFNRPKMGFAAPVSHWLRGTLRDFLRDHLDSTRFLQREFVLRPFLQQLVREHESFRRDHARWLWSLLVLELWFEWLEQPLSSAPSVTEMGNS